MSLARDSLLIRADANGQMGTGHLMRCLALAQAWQARGGNAVFVTACESEALLDRLRDEQFQVVELEKDVSQHDEWKSVSHVLTAHPQSWMVLDGYHFDPSYQRGVKQAGHPLLVIDDMAHLDHYYADIVLNQNIQAEQLEYSCEPCTRLLLGTKYVLLRREFWPWRGWQRAIPNVARKVLITLGGGDPDNQTLKVVRALQQIDVDGLEATVVVGASNPHHSELVLAISDSPSKIRVVHNVSNMAELMAWADIAVSAAGSTCWELCFLGLPSLLLVLAENQREIARRLDERGAGLGLGWHREIGWRSIAQGLEDLAYSPVRREAMSCKGREVVDGAGVERVVETLNTPDVDHGLRVRPASWHDMELLWIWANDPTVRANSFHSDPIPLDEHLEWYKRKLASSATKFWIVERADVPVAQIRYDRINEIEAEISFSVAPQHRGAGIGTQMLVLTSGKACRELGVKRLKGLILSSNEASRRTFIKAGFTDSGHDRVCGRCCHVFVQEYPQDLGG